MSPARISTGPSRAAHRVAARSLASLAAAGLLTGCFAFGYNDRDVDRTPEVNTGAGATILFPNQGGPMLPPSLYGATPTSRPGEPPVPGGAAGAYPSASSAAPGSGSGPPPSGPAPQASGAAYGAPATGAAPGYTTPAYGAGAPGEVQASSSGSGSGAPAGGGVAMLGGAHTSEVSHTKYREEPTYFKYLMLPFTILAAPFKLAWDQVAPEPEGGPALPQPQPTAPTLAQAKRPPTPDYDSAMLDRMEQELERREAASGPAPGPGPERAPTLAEELAELQRAPVPPPPPTRAEAPPRPAGQARVARAPAPADGIVDRNGDGRIDHWIFRDGPRIAREELDEDFDGRPDRTLIYAPGSGDVARVEEDADHDGRLDTWTEYREGRVLRRSADADGDGRIDTWNFYRDGRLARLERDTTGDGFRDQVGFYEDGRLARQQVDRDGDGQPDATTVFDARERVSRVEEDTDGDGRPDVVSHYEDGRLARRELLTLPTPSAGERP